MLMADGEVSVFGDGIAYFNEAAALLDLDAGVRKILTKPDPPDHLLDPVHARQRTSWRSTPATACSTASLAGPPRAACASTRA